MKRICFFIILILSFASNASALSIHNASFYTDNFGANPFGWAEGHFLQFGANVDDPLGVPDNIQSVTATAVDLGSTEPVPLFYDGGNLFWRAAPVDPTITDYGRLLIEAENKNATPDTASAFTNPLSTSVVVPLTTNILFSDFGLTPLITWDPVYYNHDLDDGTDEILVDGYHIRIYDALTNNTVFRTYAGESFVDPEFLVPEGYLEFGSDYYVRVIANDFGAGFVENRSSTWTSFSTAPVPEPTAMLLFGIGVVSLAGVRRKFGK